MASNPRNGRANRPVIVLPHPYTGHLRGGVVSPVFRAYLAWVASYLLEQLRDGRKIVVVTMGGPNLHRTAPRVSEAWITAQALRREMDTLISSLPESVFPPEYDWEEDCWVVYEERSMTTRENVMFGQQRVILALRDQHVCDGLIDLRDFNVVNFCDRAHVRKVRRLMAYIFDVRSDVRGYPIGRGWKWRATQCCSYFWEPFMWLSQWAIEYKRRRREREFAEC